LQYFNTYIFVALSYRIKYSHVSHCHWDWKPSNDSWSVLIATIMHSAAPSATRLDYCHSLSKAIMLWHSSRSSLRNSHRNVSENHRSIINLLWIVRSIYFSYKCRSANGW